MISVFHPHSKDPFICTVTWRFAPLQPAWNFDLNSKHAVLHSKAIVIVAEALMAWRKARKRHFFPFELSSLVKGKEDIFFASIFDSKMLFAFTCGHKKCLCFVFSFISTATCYQYVKYFRKNFISTQFVTNIQLDIKISIRNDLGENFTVVLWDMFN